MAFINIFHSPSFQSILQIIILSSQNMSILSFTNTQSTIHHSSFFCCFTPLVKNQTHSVTINIQFMSIHLCVSGFHQQHLQSLQSISKKKHSHQLFSNPCHCIHVAWLSQHCQQHSQKQKDKQTNNFIKGQAISSCCLCVPVSFNPPMSTPPFSTMQSACPWPCAVLSSFTHQVQAFPNHPHHQCPPSLPFISVCSHFFFWSLQNIQIMIVARASQISLPHQLQQSPSLLSPSLPQSSSGHSSATTTSPTCVDFSLSHTKHPSSFFSTKSCPFCFPQIIAFLRAHHAFFDRQPTPLFLQTEQNNNLAHHLSVPLLCVCARSFITIPRFMTTSFPSSTSLAHACSTSFLPIQHVPHPFACSSHHTALQQSPSSSSLGLVVLLLVVVSVTFFLLCAS